MNNRYTFFTDATNTTRYRFSTAIDFFNALIEAINRGDCGINSNINDNSTTSSYINRANWGDGQVMFDRGANDAANNTLEVCFDGLISRTGNDYLNKKVLDASSQGWALGSLTGVLLTGFIFAIVFTVIHACTRKSSSNAQSEPEAGNRCCR